MVINLNWLVAFLGCVALFLFWCWQSRSGMRGFLFMLLGCGVIVGAVMYQQEASRLPNIVGFSLAFLVLALLLFCLVRLVVGRRSGPAPRYQAPNEMRGRCSRCTSVALLKHYEHGWLCSKCAQHTYPNAQAA
jgi:hypothetical protein